MAFKKCPICGSKSFFVRDADEEYDFYEFELQESSIFFKPNNPGAEPP